MVKFSWHFWVIFHFFGFVSKQTALLLCNLEFGARGRVRRVAHHLAASKIKDGGRRQGRAKWLELAKIKLTQVF